MLGILFVIQIPFLLHSLVEGPAARVLLRWYSYNLAMAVVSLGVLRFRGTVLGVLSGIAVGIPLLAGELWISSEQRPSDYPPAIAEGEFLVYRDGQFGVNDGVESPPIGVVGGRSARISLDGTWGSIFVWRGKWGRTIPLVRSPRLKLWYRGDPEFRSDILVGLDPGNHYRIELNGEPDLGLPTCAAVPFRPNSAWQHLDLDLALLLGPQLKGDGEIREILLGFWYGDKPFKAGLDLYGVEIICAE
jgi:hypothetical protein